MALDTPFVTLGSGALAVGALLVVALPGSAEPAIFGIDSLPLYVGSVCAYCVRIANVGDQACHRPQSKWSSFTSCKTDRII